MLIKKIYLQLFAEGGGDGGNAAAGEGTTGEDVPAGIPDRAKDRYRKAVAANKPAEQNVPEPSTQTEPGDSYEDLIKSDKYKDAHKAYMDKTIGDRLKKYKGMEAEYTRQKAMLETVAQGYGIDLASDTYLDDLAKKIEEDDRNYEDYAMDHDISVSEARRVLGMEKQLKAIEAQQAEAEAQERARQQIMQLQQNAEKTKAIFPGFDLEREMQDEKFRKICAVTNGDTTAAFKACHHDDIVSSAVYSVANKAKVATANAIASGTRPVEQGSNPGSPSVTTPDFRHMNRDQLRAYAEEQRRLKRQ